MIDKAHIEEYFKTEQVRDNRTKIGWKVYEKRYYRVVSENIQRNSKKILLADIENGHHAKMFCAGFNKAILEMENEIERRRAG